MVVPIAAAADPRISLYRDLRLPERRRRLESQAGVFVVEGRLALATVAQSAYELLSVLVLRRRLVALAELEVPEGVPVYAVGDDVMAGVAGFDVHRGVLALARRPPPRPAEELLRGAAAARASAVVVVEGVNDQENLGAIFRNAAAFGAGAVLLSPTCADPLYRRTVRVSLGLVARVPFARLEPWPEALAHVEKSGFLLLALTPAPAAPSISTVVAEVRGLPVALAVGAEGPGLSGPALALCRPVRIPMAPGVDSLNVAAATAIALHRFAYH